MGADTAGGSGLLPWLGVVVRVLMWVGWVAVSTAASESPALGRLNVIRAVDGGGVARAGAEMPRTGQPPARPPTRAGGYLGYLGCLGRRARGNSASRDGWWRRPCRSGWTRRWEFCRASGAMTNKGPWV